ncbi:dTDP-4-dehydrorhamnose reductase [Marivivens donghaensis]|uniref:dTDP-4-dehydrorhamnose reductase n=1 Tax=Marivivens donghaensis TaxID=1699413 RepID=UPI00201F6675|nr:dTDP-4-dehydrorhamnose reductase [Marivivens donghaensis]MCL7410163.1 dTDP-4-dehydrorhamnose reductase [Marivivens donghaensis]MDN3703373.1 dTDP-4-dehydrorhamnose reductase [Marivivens donghaensis]
MNSLLVFGRTGQVARELQHLAEAQTLDLLALGREAADLAQPGTCAAAIYAHRPRVVINAAAYTAVDRAEEEEGLATAINGSAPAEMAEACAALDIPMVHISTDYVFPGNGQAPWTPSDATAPANAYGRSKLVGEEGIRASGVNHGILRTSWVFSAHGANFVKTMLRLSDTRDQISVVDDQIGGPTPARAIAAACLSIAQQLQVAPSKSGTYHFSGEPDVSWCTFAGTIFEMSGRSTRVNGIPSSAYPTPAARPLNSRLDCSATSSEFGLPRPDWQAGLKDCLIDLGILR